MKLKELRESRGLTRKELPALTGMNLRSLQDYEQGHKSVLAMKGESLYRLSLALDCTMEDILDGCFTDMDIYPQAGTQEWMDRNIRRLLSYCRIFSEKYNIYGHWEPQESHCDLVFEYEGETVRIKTNAEFTSKTLLWLNRLAELKMENYVEQKQLDAFFAKRVRK